MDKAIPLKDVRAALMCAIVRSKSSAKGRTAAFTQAPGWLAACADRTTRGGKVRPMATKGGIPLGVIRQHFAVMHTGDLDRVLERTRLEHGLDEVRRTWGIGYRRLKHEFDGCTIMC